MPVKNYPFSAPWPGAIARPCLPVTIINPENDRRLKVFAIIDTGADECAMPAPFADLLGHHLISGQPKKVSTGNGVAVAYSHTTRIEIEGFATQDVLIDFMTGLYFPLLGVRSFLANFILTINYPNQTFSLQRP